ncbi:hypothetical protein AJ80_02601 [Polytolypa hystricis UAMH7299]|uniref:Uncharacterized protein n=1 Tax=Polytolypa hystricis (strain UAMH7299) TaxID=1447883 RepID=A0A2B7YR45_POLH7|nr:hypothetical protein AJ80_02601 [Polytolypa hystricis UAMH7299]
MATTPPPPQRIPSPSTPRHGPGFDSFEPYTTRHSLRIARQRMSRARCTPPPFDSPESGSTLNASPKQKMQSPVSSQGSPRRSARIERSTRHDAFNSLHSEDTSVQASLPSSSSNMSAALNQQTSSQRSMLPTPMETPQKKTVPHPGHVARNLFPSHSQNAKARLHNTSKPRKGNKFTSFSLESFHADLDSSNQDGIVIFTDSRDRVPEVNPSEDNPFVTKPPEMEPGSPEQRSGRRRAHGRSGQRDEEVEEALRREDGMLYVFRGKKTFRKFKPDSDEEDDGTDLGLLADRPDLLEGATIPRTRPLTRSSVKPRVLFPNAAQRAAAAATAAAAAAQSSRSSDSNTEYHEVSSAVVQDSTRTRQSHTDRQPITPPVRTSVATPPSPAASARALRSQARKTEVEVEASPCGRITKEEKRNSPFDGWRRTKPQASDSRKRTSVAMSPASGEPDVKKARN